jgi:hypothetical protein
MAAPENRCEACDYWKERVESDDGVGWCLRYPPIQTVTEIGCCEKNAEYLLYHNPMTHETHVCGEFKLKPGV